MTVTAISVVRDFDAYEKYVSKNDCCRGMSFSPFDNRSGNAPVPVLYNRFLDGYDYSKEAWFVFCHEDFELQEDASALFANLDKSRLYGAAGSARRGFGGFGMQVMYGNMTECSRNGGATQWNVGKMVSKPVEVETFDCCCLIVHSSLVAKYALRFDERLLFDLYVEDFCASAKVAHGIRSFVVPLKCCHHSGSRATDRLYRHLPYLKDKYPKNCFIGSCTYFGTPSWQKKLQDRIIGILRKTPSPQDAIMVDEARSAAKGMIV